MANFSDPNQTTVVVTPTQQGINPTVAAAIATTEVAKATVGLAQTAIDSKIVDKQLKEQDEHWLKSYWRPAMAWLYGLICFMDFIGFPFLSMMNPVFYKFWGIAAMSYQPWVSLTLQNGGLVHLAFGAILGITAWTRGQEKIAVTNTTNNNNLL